MELMMRGGEEVQLQKFGTTSGISVCSNVALLELRGPYLPRWLWHFVLKMELGVHALWLMSDRRTRTITGVILSTTLFLAAAASKYGFLLVTFSSSSQKESSVCHDFIWLPLLLCEGEIICPAVVKLTPSSWSFFFSYFIRLSSSIIPS